MIDQKIRSDILNSILCKKMSKRIRMILMVAGVLALAIGTAGMAYADSPAFPLPPQLDAQPVPQFIGSPVVPKPITAPTIPQNPFMAPNGKSNIHNDAYMSDTYTTGGPLGEGPDDEGPQVLSSYLASDCISMAFDRGPDRRHLREAQYGAALSYRSRYAGVPDILGSAGETDDRFQGYCR